jgi:GNAT superfamily N-acetyltransferase
VTTTPGDPAVFAGSTVRVRIVECRPGHPDAAGLLRAFHREQLERYGFADPIELDSGEYTPPRGLFAVVYQDGAPVGCGGYRWFDRAARTVEIKRMYLTPASRGHGAGRTLLCWLEHHAVRAAAHRAILETGVRNTAGGPLRRGPRPEDQPCLRPVTDPQHRTGPGEPGMNIEVRPATAARFDDVATMLGPKNPNASVCWCLSHRLDWKTNRSLVGRARGEYVKELCGRQVAPGVLAYCDAEVAGWAAVAPRVELPFARSRKIPHVDGLPVWSVWCIRVRPGYRGRGISHVLLEGAVAYARSQGAPAIEGYPVDNQGKKVDQTMAYVGTRILFEDAGFTKAADTSSVSGGFHRVVMRLNLR